MSCQEDLHEEEHEEEGAVPVAQRAESGAEHGGGELW